MQSALLTNCVLILFIIEQFFCASIYSVKSSSGYYALLFTWLLHITLHSVILHCSSRGYSECSHAVILHCSSRGYSALLLIYDRSVMYTARCAAHMVMSALRNSGLFLQLTKRQSVEYREFSCFSSVLVR
jgi:hypothetical protein